MKTRYPFKQPEIQYKRSKKNKQLSAALPSQRWSEERALQPVVAGPRTIISLRPLEALIRG
jgi:hypothetical protein